MTFQIKVPEGMLKAAVEAYDKVCVEQELLITETRALLEAALRWMIENPIMPTKKQWEDISKDAPLTNRRMPYKWLLEEWQRRMFLASKPEPVFEIPSQLRGRTFTQEEADEIYDYVQKSVHGGRCPCNRTKLPEPEVPFDSHSHLVRDARTLCGLDEWGAGNVDIKFGIEHVTTCRECLRKISLELLSTPSPLEPEVPEDRECSDLIYAIEKAGFRTMKFGEDGLPRYLNLDETREAGRAAIEAYRRGQRSKNG